MASRYFCEELPARAGALADDVAHHLRNVMRAREGDELWLFDGAGGEAMVRVSRVPARRGLEVEVLERREAPPPPGPALELRFSPPNDAARLQQILEHGTELGVARFAPLVFERSKEAARRGPKLERWQRIARAAAGQCGRSWLPELRAPERFDAWLARDRAEPRGAAWVAEHRELWPGRCGTRADLVDAGAIESLVLVVGPEGGLSDGERAALDERGFLGIQLGEHTLRLETAALAGVALLQRWLGERAQRGRGS